MDLSKSFPEHNMELGQDDFVPQDTKDMARLGRKQEFRRDYQLWSMTAFAVMAMSGWIFVPNTTLSSLTDGNTGGTIVMYLVNFAAFTTITISLAEMASMAPTAAGQYHWASEFAPASLQKPLSYASGWLSSLAWCAGAVSGIFLAGNLIQGVIVLEHPESYTPTAWRAYLMVVALVSIVLLVNIFFSRIIPFIEPYIFGLMMLAFIPFVIVLWVMPHERLSATAVFTVFTNEGGWSSLGLSMLAGQIQLVWNLTGFDAAAHMAEETRRASSVIPQAMLYSYLLNGAMVVLMLITYCFTLTNLTEAFETPTGFPFIAIFQTVTGSTEGAAALTCVLIVLIMFSAINYTASCSRQVWAFARDRGLPFHAWIAKVDEKKNCPTRALLLVWTFSVLISLIALGSTIAFNAIISVQLLALLFTYMLSISCLIWRRLYGSPLPRGDWSLGLFGMPVNIAAMIYTIYLVIFIPFPITVPVTLASLNWAPVIFAGVVVLAGVYYVLVGRHVYDGPVAYVKGVGE